MHPPPLGGSGARLRAAWALGDMNLAPADFSADLPNQVPGFPRDEGVLHGDPPPAIRLEGVVAGIFNSIGQRDADLAVLINSACDDLTFLGGEVNRGAVAPQFLWRSEGDAITCAVPLLKGEAETELNALICAEFAGSIDSADILRTDF